MPNADAQRNLNELFEYWRLTDAAYVQLLHHWNLSLNEYFIIELLEANREGEEPAVLAETLNVLRQSITVSLNNLEERGYIARKPDKQDRRRKKIVLTAAGRKFAAEVLPAIRGIELDCIADWTEAEQRLIIDLSKRFYERVVNAAKKLR